MDKIRYRRKYGWPQQVSSFLAENPILLAAHRDFYIIPSSANRKWPRSNVGAGLALPNKKTKKGAASSAPTKNDPKTIFTKTYPAVYNHLSQPRLEKEVDELVFELYELTGEEIKMIEQRK